jgi:hypothetical protein
MPRKIKNTAILAKIETTYGTDALPTGAADALLISNPTPPKYNYNNAERDNVRVYFGASEELAGTRYVTLDFEVEVSGSGTAGTAPAWGKLLRACAMAEVVTAAQRVEYTPISAGLESLTIYYHVDGVVHKALGCMGTAEVMLEESGIPKFMLSFTGVDGGQAAVANPSTTLTAWKTPLVITNTNTAAVKLGAAYDAGALTGGTDFCSRGLTLTLGNDVKFTSMLGPCTGVDIYDRDATGSVQLDLDAAAEVAAFQAVNANTLISMGLEHGSSAGAKVLFFAPAVQRTNPTHQDFEGRVLMGFDLRLLPVAGNDELRIVAL